MGALTVPGFPGNIVPGGTLLFGNGSAAAPSISFSSDQDTGFYRSSENNVRISCGNADIMRWTDAPSVVIRVDAGLQWGSAGVTSADLSLFRDAANILAQRNGTNAQAFHLYNTFTDSSNYERAQIDWSSNVLLVGSSAAGTGTGRSIRIGTFGAAGALELWTQNTERWRVQGDGMFRPGTDNSLDIGTSGAFRPRSIFVGTSLQIEANNGLKLTNQTDGAAAQVGTLTNAPSAGNPSFWLPVTINGNNRFIPCWT